jgi:hypothetical protein
VGYQKKSLAEARVSHRSIEEQWPLQRTTRLARKSLSGLTPGFFDLLAGDADPIFAEVILANTFCEIAGFSSWAKHTGYLS